MKHLDVLRNILFGGLLAISATLQAAPEYPINSSKTDWLIDSKRFKARCITHANGQEIELNNGLISRTFRLQPNAATVAFQDEMRQEPIIRAVRPEARLELDGIQYDIGGLTGQPIQNYLDADWISNLKQDTNAFLFKSWSTNTTQPRFPWKKRLEWMPHDAPWPPPGVSLTLEFKAPGNAHSAVTVQVHYELYDGIPLISKWLTVHNGGSKPVQINTFVSEILAAVEQDSVVDPNSTWEPPRIWVETDYSFCGMSGVNHSPAVFWQEDPTYKTQVNYDLKTPCLLECKPPLGPDQKLAPGADFETFRTFVLAYDSTDRERQGLAKRRMYRTIAPWAMENPILMHVRSAKPDAVKAALDQCKEVGFEMMILTFGSGFDFESRDSQYQKSIRELTDYARSKGIALGGYSLLASRGAATEADNTQGAPKRFGVMPCLGAQWGRDYLHQLQSFMENAGLEVLEHDGSYPGDFCAATNHPGHQGMNDSQWIQWTEITGLYKWCRANGVYLNIPDWYFLNGGSKTGMGYRENNWSLPRAYQEIIERQNIYDGTWDKTPSMGWMFVPLTEYHGGGEAATIEPLKEHLSHYEQRLANLFGAGVIACYRGPRLYDAPETKAVVQKWVQFYKKHRAILNSDLIHLRRPNGADLDYMMHVNPELKEKGLLMVYNPLNREVSKKLSIPLYYTGIETKALVSEQDKKPVTFHLNRHYCIELPVNVPAHGVTWFVIQ